MSARQHDLRPATREEVLKSLEFALRVDSFDRAVATAFMASPAVRYLLDHLADEGYVLMRKPRLEIPRRGGVEF